MKRKIYVSLRDFCARCYSLYKYVVCCPSVAASGILSPVLLLIVSLRYTHIHFWSRWSTSHLLRLSILLLLDLDIRISTSGSHISWRLATISFHARGREHSIFLLQANIIAGTSHIWACVACLLLVMMRCSSVLFGTHVHAIAHSITAISTATSVLV